MSQGARLQRVEALSRASSNASQCAAISELAQSRYQLRPAVGRIREVSITEAMVQTRDLWPVWRPRLGDYPVVAQFRGVYHLTGAGTPANRPLPTQWIINPNSGCRENPPGNNQCLGTRFVIQEFGTGNGGVYIDRRVFLIPPNSTLYFQVFDTHYPDNTISRDATNSPRVALWQPVHPEDAPAALGNQDAVPDMPPPAKPIPAPRPPSRPSCSERWLPHCSGQFSFPPRDAILQVARGEAAIARIKHDLAPFSPYVDLPVVDLDGGSSLNVTNRIAR